MDLYIYILALYSIQVDIDKLPFTIVNGNKNYAENEDFTLGKQIVAR